MRRARTILIVMVLMAFLIISGDWFLIYSTLAILFCVTGFAYYIHKQKELNDRIKKLEDKAK